MLIKHWKTTADRDGKRMTLYAITRDDKVSQDLAVGLGRSLILASRLHMFQSDTEYTNEANHFLMACGAFSAHCHNGMTLENNGVFPVETVPDRDADNHVGGDGRGFFVPIWEEPID